MRETILVVDDEPANRELLEAILVEDGYEIVHAENVPRAIQAIKASSPDLVLLDLMLPLIHGLDLCRALKQNVQTANIPIIIVTALSETSAKEAAQNRGAEDYLTKPVQAEDLRARVAAVLKARRSRAQASLL